MLTLGIDACLGHCSAALLRGGDVVASRSEAMARGHVERLAAMVAQVLAEGDAAPRDLDLVATTHGPGGFTGARLGAAFARGLALAADCRAVGVTTLAALAFPRGEAPLVVALDGRRGDLFVQAFGAGETRPEAIAADALDAFVARHGGPPVVGPRDLPAIDPAHVARLAMAADDAPPPTPLYLRAPDAKAAARPVLR